MNQRCRSFGFACARALLVALLTTIGARAVPTDSATPRFALKQARIEAAIPASDEERYKLAALLMPDYALQAQSESGYRLTANLSTQSAICYNDTIFLDGFE